MDYENIDCKIRDAQLLIYEVARGDHPAVIRAVYDGGLRLSISRNVDSFQVLVSLQGEPGTVAICPPAGLIRLFAIPVFPVTADAAGDFLHLPRVMSNHELAGAVSLERREELRRKGLLA